MLIAMRQIRHCGIMFAVGFVLAGCAKNNQDPPVVEQRAARLDPTPSTSPSPVSVAITVHGALREIMHLGRTERQ